MTNQICFAAKLLNAISLKMFFVGMNKRIGPSKAPYLNIYRHLLYYANVMFYVAFSDSDTVDGIKKKNVTVNNKVRI